MRNLKKCSPLQWYGEQIVNTLRKVVSTMLNNAKSNGFFTNHSLRCSGTTRLFQNGIDRKLEKEFTGHTSDTKTDTNTR